jgi:hypothetical protein
LKTRKLIILFTITLLLGGLIYLFFIKKEKVEYDFPCGVPRVWINPMSTDSIQGQFLINYELAWKQEELSVYFMDDNITNETVQKILNIASEWSNYANIRFKPTNDIEKSDIRIQFSDLKGYTSEIGNSAMKMPYKTTMYLGRLDIENDNDKIRSAVLHEFGHSLGLLHELHNPENPIQWDSVKVYKYFKKTNDWNEEKVNQQIFGKIESNEHSNFDLESVMTYPIPPELTLNNYGISVITKLSEIDKEYISQYYK